MQLSLMVYFQNSKDLFTVTKFLTSDDLETKFVEQFMINFDPICPQPDLKALSQIKKILRKL